MLSSREAASALIIVAAGVAVLCFRPSRRAIPDVLRAATHWRLLVLWSVYGAYSILTVWLASRLHAWDPSMLKDTVLVVLGTGLPLLFSANKLRDGPGFFRSTVSRTIGTSALIGLYVNLAAFSFWLELPLQVFMIAVGLLDVAAARMPNTRPLRRVLSVLTVTAGILVLWHTTTVVTRWSAQDWVATSRVAGMSVWFVAAMLPFVYVVAYWMRCEQIFSLLRVQNPGHRRPPRRVRLAVVLGLRGSVRYAHRFVGRWYGRVGRMRGYREAARAMTVFRSGSEAPALR
jgi:hypothetical protein